MASVFQAAASEEIKAQPWYVRFKGSILIAASGVVWILQELVTSPDIQAMGWGGALGAVATVAAFFLNRFTRDGITPSMAKRLEQAGMMSFQERASNSGVYAYHEPDAADNEPDEPLEEYEPVAPAPRVIYVPLDQGAERPARPAADDADDADDELPTYTGESSAP